MTATSLDELTATSRELGFVRGLALAAKIARENGDLSTCIRIGEVIFTQDTFVLANTKDGEGTPIAPELARETA